MGKKHASQYANFGWLQYANFGWLLFKYILVSEAHITLWLIV